MFKPFLPESKEGTTQFIYTLPDGTTFQCLAPKLEAPASVYIDGEFVGKCLTVGNARQWFDNLKDCMERGLVGSWIGWKQKYLVPVDDTGTPVNEGLDSDIWRGKMDAKFEVYGDKDNVSNDLIGRYPTIELAREAVKTVKNGYIKNAVSNQIVEAIGDSSSLYNLGAACRQATDLSLKYNKAFSVWQDGDLYYVRTGDKDASGGFRAQDTKSGAPVFKFTAYPQGEGAGEAFGLTEADETSYDANVQILTQNIMAAIKQAKEDGTTAMSRANLKQNTSTRGITLPNAGTFERAFDEAMRRALSVTGFRIYY